MRRYCVAYSGGLDSSVLLHVASSLKRQLPNTQIRAIHVNHGLSPLATNWEQHCHETCEILGIDFQAENIGDIIQTHIQMGDSIEEAARITRYSVFRKYLQPEEILLTGHHQDDQAETVLLQLFRGAGIKGLAAMPAFIKFSVGYLFRPFLQLTRTELEQYAKQHSVNWIDDESNVNARFDRNYLRQIALPTMQNRWPNITHTLARVAQHCAEASELLEELADQDLVHLTGQHPGTLSISKLLRLSNARLKNSLRRWIHQKKFLLPTQEQLQQVIDHVLPANIDTCPLVCWSGAEIRRYRDDLYCIAPLAAHDATLIIPWDLKSPFVLPNNLGILQPKKLIEQGLNVQGPITIRFRQGGERCHPTGRIGSHPLKKLMQEWGIPPWLRNRIPLLYMGNDIIAVYGYCISTNATY